MAHPLHNKERELLSSLAELESEYDRHSNKIDDLTGEINTIKETLDSIRIELLDEFLTEHISPLLIAYDIKTSVDGEILVGFSVINGGELEFDKLQNGINWHDINNVPLFYVLSYLEKGTPWTTDTLHQYDIEEDVEFYPVN